jgi:hypothetical protein
MLQLFVLICNFKCVRLRPLVEEANKIAPTFAHVAKDMIIITESSRPLPRAAKGTVVRKQAITLYNDEIERL